MRGADAILIDFGAARLHKPENQTDTQVLGTTGFAAPEQYGLSQSDIRTDIYALGILINIMLTGQHPSKKPAEGKLGRVVGRCTHVNPQKRYKNVLRLMDALQKEKGETALSHTCPHCGAPLPEKAAFCPYCAKSINIC